MGGYNMQLKKMFYKEIDRDIKGVIKIGQDDNANVYQELEEYVVTRELNQHFGDFFEAYSKGLTSYTDKMGVWISGFFGSGKSHFLKILSYLLDNKEINGSKAVSYFDDKLMDSKVLADINRAGDNSVDVILFNIDSKSDSTSKSNKDAIVKVFMKVFNEMQGFCASLPWVADLERQLVKDNNYESFKSSFKELSGNSWEEAREDFYFEEDSIVQALAMTTKMSEDAARNWYNKAEENYSLSVEKFANKVKDYIESKGKNHHVVFLVDEMGQYIGDDTNLMLNLQTVVEDLGTYCGGKAWVIVTSQQDIDSITKVKGNDFSKIQGRFNTRLNLSSSNVDEVIKKRILRKTDVAKDTLKLLYQDKEAVLKNLITFTNDTAEMKFYKSNEDFIEVYPFVTYQFNLLQSVFTGIRLHGSSGKHLSEGERSLLSAFQESAIKYSDKEIGALIPFSAFYNTVEAFLDSNIRTVIIKAGDNERLDEYDVEVLKVLFLIKYVPGIPSNIENIATLLVNHMENDKIQIKKRIEESLKKLLREALIQKNGNEFIFLTNEEQDVNKEIQNISVDLVETIMKIGEEIFEGIYNEKKYRYNARYHFDFNKIIDDRFLSTQRNEIGLKVITPYYDTGVELTDQELKMMSARENNLILKLPMDTTFLEEMEEILKIQNYLLRKGGTSGTAEIEEIKIRKSREVVERKERVKMLLVEAIKTSDIYANSQKLEVKSKNPIERINEGFKVLIESMYNKLNYITTYIESNKDLNDILLENDIQMKLTDDTPNKLAIDELQAYIDKNTKRNIPMTVKSIINMHSKSPYGWKDLDIIGLILRLFKGQDIKLQLGQEYLNPSEKDLINYLTKRDYQDRCIVKTRIKTPIIYINNVRELSKEVFGIAAMPNDEDGLMDRFKEYCARELNLRSPDTDDYGIYLLLEKYKNNKYYPGKEVLEKGLELFEQITKIKDVSDFYEKVYELKDDLLDYEEDVFDVKKFFKNQSEIFDKAAFQLSIFEKNRTYVIDKETLDIVKEIELILNLKEPYLQIHRLPDLINSFRSNFIELLEVECKPIRKVIEADYKTVSDELDIYKFSNEFISKIKHRFENLLERLDSVNNFYEAIAMKEESDRIKLRCFNDIEAENKRIAEENHGNDETREGEDDSYNKVTKNISIKNILRGVKIIETKDDIDEVVEEFRRKLIEELKDDTKLKLV